MGGIIGIGAVDGTNEPVPTNKKGRDRAHVPKAEADAVAISSEAAQAADATRLVREAEKVAEHELQLKRIEEAKRSIEEGTYKVQSVVLEIASRITGYVAR